MKLKTGTRSNLLLLPAAICLALGLCVSSYAQGVNFSKQDENPRGAATGPTKARGHSHPNQYLHVKATQIAENMEPVMVHEAEVKQAREKLAALESKTGKKPNILVFLTDDCGWMDFGFNGGGEAVGNATPNLDRIAAQGLVLTSAYSTPSSWTDTVPG